MHVRLKPTALIDAQQVCTRVLALLLICSLIYAMFAMYQSELFNSPHKFVPGIPTNETTTTIIVVTPTHKRKERIADMLRLSQTLNHVRNLHWIVVEDGTTTVNAVERLLIRSTIPYVYLATTTAPGMPARGWTHRNLALRYIRENYNPQMDAVLYFADDDNSYDVRLFDKYIRKVKRLGIWPVGLVGGAWVEAPKVGSNGKVISWDVVYAPSREFATDMAGFAVHLREVFRVQNATFDQSCAKKAAFGPEPCFLKLLGFKKEDVEPFGHNDTPKDILVWHTKTVASKGSGPDRGFVIE